MCKTHPLNTIRTGHVPCGHGFFSAAKGVYAKGITFYKPSYFQTRRAEIPSLKGFLFYLMRHFPPPEAAFLLFDCHRPQESSRFPRLSERKALVQAVICENCTKRYALQRDITPSVPNF